jgi:hypothetical protein
MRHQAGKPAAAWSVMAYVVNPGWPAAHLVGCAATDVL